MSVDVISQLKDIVSQIGKDGVFSFDQCIIVCRIKKKKKNMIK